MSGDDSTASGLTLYITGDAPRSQRARANLARALEGIGFEASAFAEVDLLEWPDQVFELGILATPALARRGDGQNAEILYGDLSDTERLYRFLGRGLGA